MKTLAVLLGLGVAGVQSFPLDDCACPEVVRAEPDCPDGCCGAPDSEPSPCVRAEPSPDLAAPGPVETVLPATAALVRPTPEPRGRVEAIGVDDPAAWLRRPARGRPLYLLDATFLI